MSDLPANGYQALDPCVHCGFCLPACPTYLATGDENDSPRGRIVLMRAMERGELLPTDPAVRHHLDRCLGCRGCEPACPSGVGYGAGLETARATIHESNGSSWATRLGLSIFTHPIRWRTFFGVARLVRATRLPTLLAGPGPVRFPLGMLSASQPGNRGGGKGDGSSGRKEVPPGARPTAKQTQRGTVALFSGCVMDTLFRHVNQATRRTLEANGLAVVDVTGQSCCGAPLLHAGDGPAARDLLAESVRRFDSVDAVVVNSAGCGAILKEAGSLLGTEGARRFAAKVKDVTEVLAEAGPMSGADVPLDVAYDPPCHLQHAQGVHDETLQVLRAIPRLEVRVLPGADQCCGSAGVFNLQHPELAGRILAAKMEVIAAASPRPSAMVTGNPGCLMQIGAGLLAAKLPIDVLHPVELLDRSYHAAGLYE